MKRRRKVPRDDMAWVASLHPTAEYSLPVEVARCECRCTAALLLCNSEDDPLILSEFGPN